MRIQTLAIVAAAVSGVLTMGSAARAGFFTGAAADYGIIAGPNTASVQFNNSTYNGNVGIDNPNTTVSGNFLQMASNAYINGNLDFVGPAQSNLNGGVVTGSISGNVSNVSTAYNAIAALSSTFAGESATSFGGTGTLIGTSGTLDGSGNYVFTTTANNFLASGELTINAPAGTMVVINVTGNNNVQLKNLLSLTGGITDDNVFINITGTGQNVTGNTNGGIVNGAIIALNDNFNVDNTVIDGRIVGGGTGNFQLVSGMIVNSPVVPEPASLGMLGLGVVGLLARRRRA